MDSLTADLKPLNTPQETAAFLGRTVSALANDRHTGAGLPFVRVGRSIRYERSAIAEYIAANRFIRTDERAAS
ncbi:DNA-binding protein [Rathayibacter sp. AY1E8]|uniref:helix-turn-helix domain-containing protein n=1 Tax=unclassified Rathayibacter TaxID=2609250 RepID=UPI000CE78526|nr:DNA-binding protein [Rathayibacter sp. AY1E8]PPH63123.1 DNA-binding protein [Rathayibacter sp. AY1D7]